MNKALLINDSKFESMVLKDLLRQLGYDVELATEYDGIYMFEQFDPELVIVNYIMEKTRGDEVVSQLKASNPDLICLISSNSSLALADYQEAGVDAILRTPVSAFTLRDVLRRAYGAAPQFIE